MARRNGTREELIKCEYCGEMYAASYKHCPFCNEDGTGSWDDPVAPEDEERYEDDLPVRGGRRLAGRSRWGGNGPSVRSIISWALSLALIIAAAGIVFSLIRPILSLGKRVPGPTDSAPPVTTAVSPEPTVSAEPSAEATEVPAPTPSVGVQTPSVPLVTATDFTLSREDISFFRAGEYYQFQVTMTPAGAHGDITWKSSDPNVASVSWNGLVTAISKGTVTVTASIEGVGERKCIVRCQLSDSAPAATAVPPAAVTSTPTDSASGITLSREDITLKLKENGENESWRLVVSGTSSAVTWASSDPAIATVSGDGTVKAVSKGTCRVTATVGGVTLKCIIRCSY